MLIYDILHKKRLGKELTDEEIAFFVRSFTDGAIPDYQAAALLMAICINGMTERETVSLTLAMENSGETVDLSSIPGIKADKHSTGGVGDKTSLVVCPIVAACGVPVAKMSGRGLGHTGGTLDKLEAIPGTNVSLSMEQFLGNVRKVGFALTGQTGSVAPADKKLYALRDVTATVDSIPLIASSIMSKKLASGANAIVLDVKTGSGAFMKTFDESVSLARAMVSIGCSTGRETAALITDMDVPLGHTVGNSIEVAEAAETLRGRGESDLLSLSLALSSLMLSLALEKSVDDCRVLAENAVSNGSAFDKLCEMVSAQGGNAEYLKSPSLFPKAAVQEPFLSTQSGYILHMDCERIGLAALAAGAGREKLGDEIDHSAGITLLKKTGEYVKKGEVIANVLASDVFRAGKALTELGCAVKFSEEAPERTPLIRAIVTKNAVTSLE